MENNQTKQFANIKKDAWLINSTQVHCVRINLHIQTEVDRKVENIQSLSVLILDYSVCEWEFHTFSQCLRGFLQVLWFLYASQKHACTWIGYGVWMCVGMVLWDELVCHPGHILTSGPHLDQDNTHHFLYWPSYTIVLWPKFNTVNELLPLFFKFYQL